MQPRLSFPILISLALVGCVKPRVVPPAPPPAVVRPTPLPPAPIIGWQDRALSPGSWSFASSASSSVARYGLTATPPIFSITCDKSNRSISLALPNAGVPVEATSITLRATTAAKSVLLEGGGRFTRAIAPRDPILDALAFSRGRFAVELGATALILPTWPEFTRVIEDCRG